MFIVKKIELIIFFRFWCFIILLIDSVAKTVINLLFIKPLCLCILAVSYARITNSNYVNFILKLFSSTCELEIEKTLNFLENEVHFMNCNVVLHI